MHAAPPVRMSLAPDRAWHAIVTLCASAAGANLAAWAALQAQASLQIAAVAALLAGACAGLLASRSVRRRSAATAVLVWDGATWYGSPGVSAPSAGEVRVMIDLGVWLLLRFAPTLPEQPAAWLATSRRHAGALWPAWRAALYSRRPSPDRPSAPDPT